MSNLTGRSLNGRYLVGELIGSGGMAHVYKGHDIRSGRTTAIKVLRQEYNEDAEFVKRFEREAQAASSIAHENLIELYDVGVEDGIHYITMDFVDGMSLKQLTERQGVLDIYTAVSIARQMCLALQAVHDGGIIHRDIKSQNILLDRRGIAKLADFGIAKATDANTITVATDGVLGSVHYFSPEQARGEGVSRRSDLYSLGVVLFEMVTGKLPFEGDSPVSVALHHLNTPVPSARKLNPKVSKAIDDIIQKAMDKDPEKRYQTALDFYNDLCLALVYPDGGFFKKGNEGPKNALKLSKVAVEEEEQAKRSKSKLTAEINEVLGEKNDDAPATLGGFMQKYKRAVWLAALGVAFVIAVVLFAKVLFDNALLPGWKKTPSLYNMQMAEASERLARSSLALNVESFVFSDELEAGAVIDQTPAYNSPIREGGTVRVRVSKGLEYPEVPDLVSAGMHVEEAKLILERRGLKLGEMIADETSTLPMYTVLAQSEKAGDLLRNGEAVDLVVSMPPIVFEVPSLRGMSQEEAVGTLRAQGLSLGDVNTEYTTEVEVGQIIRQSPEAGTTLGQGETVSIWICAPYATYVFEKEIVIEEDDTVVLVHMVDPATNENKRMFTAEYDKGTYTIEVNLVSPSEGEKTIELYMNGTIVSSETVYFEEVRP